MNSADEIILRQYLKRKIAVKNNSFSGMTSSFRENAKILRNNIFTAFARGKDGSYAATRSNLNLRDVRDHIRNTGNRMSPYNYFDLDTLIAYDAFLEMIINQANINRMKDHKIVFDLDHFDTALKYVVPKYFIEHAGEFETGYYDIKCPVRILRDGRNRPMPERTPDARSFDKKYSVTFCERLLNDYLDEKHPEDRLLEPEDAKYEEDLLRYDFVYRGVQYKISSEQHYLGDDSQPIRYIVADSLDRKINLRGYFDLGMTEYVGNIYDMENNFLASPEDSGVDIYGDNSRSR